MSFVHASTGGWAHNHSTLLLASTAAVLTAATALFFTTQRSRASSRQGPVRVSELYVHPIKSCRGSTVQSARFTPAGLEYDRRWILADLSNSEVLTARTEPQMVLIHPIVNEEQQTLDITFPEGSDCKSFSVPLNPTTEQLSHWRSVGELNLFHITGLDGYVCESLPGHPNASEQLSKFMGLTVELVMKGPIPRLPRPTTTHPELGLGGDGTSIVFQDGYPLLVASSKALKRVEDVSRKLAREGAARVDPKWATETLTMSRFRPNIVLSGCDAFAEDGWAEATIGDEQHRLELVSLCTRCALPQVDPATGKTDVSMPTKALAGFRKGLDPSLPHKNCFGVNAVARPAGVGEVGTIHVGDVVNVLRLAEGRFDP